MKQQLKAIQPFVNPLKKYKFARLTAMSDGAIGSTSDFGSESSRFESWSDNKIPIHTHEKEYSSLLPKSCFQRYQ